MSLFLATKYDYVHILIYSQGVDVASSVSLKDIFGATKRKMDELPNLTFVYCQVGKHMKIVNSMHEKFSSHANIFPVSIEDDGDCLEKHFVSLRYANYATSRACLGLSY